MLVVESPMKEHKAAKEYKAVVVDDDEVLRKLLVECLRFTYFEKAEGYDEAEILLRDLSALPPADMPDLIIVDLQLQPLKMQGLELISELAARDIPSEVVAISGNHPSADLVEAIRIGAGAMVPKPFGDILHLVIKMCHLAEIGKKRRLKVNVPDPDRQERPVFLSYCSDDAKLATGLRRNIEAREIGVWYDLNGLRGGDEWRPRIEDQIDQASVFIALITDNYLRSPICYGELLRFRSRMETTPEPRPLLLPLLDGLSAEGKKNPLLRPILDRYQCIDLSLSERFIDGLSALLGHIDFHMYKVRKATINEKWNGGGPDPTPAPENHIARGVVV